MLHIAWSFKQMVKTFLTLSHIILAGRSHSCPFSTAHFLHASLPWPSFASSFPLTRSSRRHRQWWRVETQGSPCRLQWPRFFSSLPLPAEGPTTPGHWTDSARPCSRVHNCNSFNQFKVGFNDNIQSHDDVVFLATLIETHFFQFLIIFMVYMRMYESNSECSVLV